MDPKLLTEGGWKTVASKYKVKDNGLQRALASLDKLDDKDYEARRKAIDSVDSLATALKRNKEIAANAPVVKYLEDVLKAADAAGKQVATEAAAAEKEAAQAKKAEEQKAKEEKAKGDKDSKDDDDEDEQEEEEGDYSARLLKALMKVRSGNKALDFIICDARPAPALMVAKRITPKMKQELTEITGGSKRFLPVGSCHFEGGGFVFSTPNAVAGLARKIQLAIKDHTGKKFKIVYGGESADEEGGEEGGKPGDEDAADAAQDAGAAAPPGEAAAEGAEGAGAAGGAAPPPPQAETPAPPKPELIKAPDVWHGTRDTVDQNINALKKAVKAHYASGHPDLLKEIDQGMAKLDVILDKLDTRLEDSLKKAATDKAELKNSKAILIQYITYVKSEPMIAHIDSNPFGVQTNLKKVLTDSLTHMAQAIS
jgi:hypothetical protein